MSYIGNTPVTQNFVAGSDQFNGDGSTTVFTLSRNVNTVNDIQVVVSNVPQDPFTAYTVAGNSLTFTSAPPSGTGNIYVVYRATNVQTFVPSPGSVGISQLSATGTPSSGTFLRGDNSWAAAGAQNDIFYENGQTVSTNYTITSTRNAMSAGPVTINTGVTVTIDTGGNWVIV